MTPSEQAADTQRAPADGMAPRCCRCRTPIEWTALWTPYCGAVCSGADAMDRLEARRAERLRLKAQFHADTTEAAVSRVQAAVVRFLNGGGE